MTSLDNHVEQQALKALERAGCKEHPVPIDKVAEYFGLEIVEFPFHNKISGLLKKDEGIIGINQTHPLFRKRFTIAHELGHFLLGHGIKQQEETIDGSFDAPYPEEREANHFAASILMPAEWVKKAKSHNRSPSSLLEELSQSFGVSKQVATIRLLELDLL